MAYLITQFKLLAEYLDTKTKENYDSFAKVNNSIKAVVQFEFSSANSYTLKELGLEVGKILEYFELKNAGVSFFKTLPIGVGNLLKNNPNLYIAQLLSELLEKISNLSTEEYNVELKNIEKQFHSPQKKEQAVFIGHGKNKLWSRVALFIREELKIPVFSFETESRTSESITNILTNFLDTATFAILVLTAEDETAIGFMRARQNVIHEAGLFQGKLGFEKVILLKHHNIEDVSNLAGLQYISFTDDNIEQTFYELNRVLKKHGLIK